MGIIVPRHLLGKPRAFRMFRKDRQGLAVVTLTRDGSTRDGAMGARSVAIRAREAGASFQWIISRCWLRDCVESGRALRSGALICHGKLG
jgi:hypothetical protein